MIQHVIRLRRHIAAAAAFAYVSLVLAPSAYASGSSMPWEEPLEGRYRFVGVTDGRRRYAGGRNGPQIVSGS